MMRLPRLPLLFSLILGLAALGCGGTPTGSTEPAPPDTSPPKAELRGENSINAGEADYGMPREFTFTVANTGGADLVLTLFHISCSCEDVQLPADPIKPGGEGKVVIHWFPIVGSAGAYTLTADVQTNDPKNKMLRFQVNAHIQPLVRVFVEGKESDPEFFGLDYGEEPIAADKPRVREVKVFSTRLPKFDLRVDSSVEGFDIQKPVPLPAGTVVGDYDVKSGYKFEVSTTKNLPIGYVRGQLNLALSHLGEGEPDRTITLPIYAIVGQGVFTLSQPGALLFTKPTLTEEDTARINLSFNSPPANESVTVKQVEPSFLKVDNPEKERDGRWRITAHIPANNPEAAKLQADPPMYGKVILEVAGLPQPVIIKVIWRPQPQEKPK
jgi:hypothetical protein